MTGEPLWSPAREARERWVNSPLPLYVWSGAVDPFMGALILERVERGDRASSRVGEDQEGSGPHRSK